MHGTFVGLAHGAGGKMQKRLQPFANEYLAACCTQGNLMTQLRPQCSIAQACRQHQLLAAPALAAGGQLETAAVLADGIDPATIAHFHAPLLAGHMQGMQ
ncbi:hypothetical protein D9M71_608350 [compost metagenome]